MNQSNKFYNTIEILNLDLVEVEKTFEYKNSALKVLLLQQRPHLKRGPQVKLTEVQVNALNLYNEEQVSLAKKALDQATEEKNAQQQQIALQLEAELQHRSEVESKMQRLVALNEALNTQVELIPDLQNQLAEANVQRIETEKSLADLSAKIETLQALVSSFEAEKAQREDAVVLEDARIQGKIDGFGKYVGYFLVGIVISLLMVAVFMNVHNLGVLYSKVIPTPILVIFAITISGMPLVYAWLKDEFEISASTFMLPIDFVLTIILFLFLNQESYFVQNSEWLKTTLPTIHVIISCVMGVFYGWQIYMLVNKALAVFSKPKYEKFYRNLFR